MNRLRGSLGGDPGLCATSVPGGSTRGPSGWLIGVVAQQVAWLAIECAAEPGESAEADGPGAAVLGTDRLTMVTPTRSDSSVSVIRRSVSKASRRIAIAAASS